MAVNFPNSPSLNETFSQGNITWRWNGYAWNRIPDPGAKGEEGDKGQEGDQGLTGSQGNKGEKGLKGDVEEKGNKGQKGEKGTKGEEGQKGIKGEKGEKGEKGVKGEIGGQGIKGTIGIQGDKAGLRYQYSHNTGMSDPGGGIFRYNNSSTLGSVSSIAIDATTKEGTDLSDYIATWDDSTNDIVKGHIIVKSNENGDATYTVFEVTGLTDNSGWLQISVQNPTGNFPSNNEECVIQFYRVGNKGEKGQKGEKGTKGEKGQKGSGTQITISDAAPGSGNNGDLWWASDDFDLHVYYDDGDSSQWVSITSNTSLKGEKGEKGQKGEIGVKGAKGEGDKGQKGEGDKGEKGVKGEIGTTTKGEKGSTGADNSTKGQKGATGADNSTKGQKGEIGADNSSKGQKGEGDKGQKGEDGSLGIPTGTIAMFGGNSAPSGWQVCNGGAASTGALQAIVGSNVPDLRDRFIVGAHGSYSINTRGGANSVTLTTAQIPAHDHDINVGTAGGGGGGFVSDRDSEAAGTNGPDTVSIQNTGGGQSHENRPPFHALIFIIKT